MRKFYQKFPVVQHIPLDQLKDSPFQPRVDYGDIEELAASIKSVGLREPILVRPIYGGYEIVHGHRRVRALQLLGAPFAACYVQDMDDKTAIEVALNQNIQREDLNPIEEGRAFKEYIKMFDISQRAFGRKIGKDSHYINYRVRLLDLPEEIQAKVASGAMSFSNARELLNIIDRKGDIIGISMKIREGELKGTAQVKDAIDAVKSGIDIDKAVEIAHLRSFQREMAKRLSTGGRSVKEILKGIRSRQAGPEVILKAQRENYLNVVKEMLEKGLLVCPGCEKSHFSCSHCGRELT